MTLSKKSTPILLMLAVFISFAGLLLSNLDYLLGPPANFDYVKSVLDQTENPTLKVHLLDHTGAKQWENRFWIDWNEEWQGVVAVKTASPADTQKIIKLLQKSLDTTEAMHLCGHSPVYGIEIFESGQLILSTSLCFSCLTWVRPGKRYYLSGKVGAENALCKALRAVIELPPELLQPESQD